MDAGSTAPRGTDVAAAPGPSGLTQAPPSWGPNSQVCTASQLQQARMAMDSSPIVVPNVGANLNEAGVQYQGSDGAVSSPCTTPGSCTMTGPTTWLGLTLEEAEAVLCAGSPVGDLFGDGKRAVIWGANGEVTAEYDPLTHFIDYIGLGAQGTGYLGTMTFTSPDGTTTYTVSLQPGTPISATVSGGQPTAVALDWQGYFSGANPGAISQFDLLYRAFMSTYFPSIWEASPEPPAVTCDHTGACVLRQSGSSSASFSIPAAGWTVWVSASQTGAGLTPNRIDLNLTRQLSFAGEQPYLALNAQGPFTLPHLLGAAASPCSLTFGLSYADFLADCVETGGGANANASELNALLATMSHDNETFQFNIPGIDLNFADTALTQTQIVSNWTPGVTAPTPLNTPSAPDSAFQLTVDSSVLGLMVNDYALPASTPVQDLHGAGALWNELRRLVIANVYVEATGAPPPDVDALIRSCVPQRDATTGEVNDPHWDPANPGAWITYEQSIGCTGAENMLSAATTSDDDPVNIGTAVVGIDSGYALGLRPGHQKAVFCLDAASTADMQHQVAQGSTDVGPQYCAAPYGAEGDVLVTLAAQVQAVWGRGKASNLPVDLQDGGFFFKMYGEALVKTLEWLGDFDLTATPYAAPSATVDSYPIEQNDLVFLALGNGQEQMNYIDRRFVCPDSTAATPDNDCLAPQPPTEILLSADLPGGVIEGYFFDRYLDRGEVALATAFQLPDPSSTTTPPANLAVARASNLLLTNLTGSEVATTWPSYECAVTDPSTATTAEQVACEGLLAPVDSTTGQLIRDVDGNPIFTAYALAFPNSVGIISSPLQIGSANLALSNGSGTTAAELEAEGQTLVTVPLASAGTITELLPFVPQSSGGFPIMVNAGYDRWIPAAQLDFSGAGYTAVVSLLQNPPPMGASNQVLAIQSTDFLGEVFVCYDQGTGDLLTTRMYDNMANLLNWLNAHPDAALGSESTECNIGVRWSNDGSTVDVFESTTNGVRIQGTPGAGFGRVAGATVYEPLSYGPPQ